MSEQANKDKHGNTETYPKFRYWWIVIIPRKLNWPLLARDFNSWVELNTFLCLFQFKFQNKLLQRNAYHFPIAFWSQSIWSFSMTRVLISLISRVRETKKPPRDWEIKLASYCDFASAVAARLLFRFDSPIDSFPALRQMSFYIFSARLFDPSIQSYSSLSSRERKREFRHNVSLIVERSFAAVW